VSCLCARSLLATGYRRLEADGRDEFEGAGVYYAATGHQGRLCCGSTVLVAGAGNSAGQAAMFLSEHAAKVLLVIRGEGLGKSMSSYLAERADRTHFGKSWTSAPPRGCPLQWAILAVILIVLELCECRRKVSSAVCPAPWRHS